jgi:hypothetical protein
MRQVTRPDGRCFVFGEPDDDLPRDRVYAGARRPTTRPTSTPATYLVALGENGEEIGIARVWMRRDGPRLGLVGVRPDWRRRTVGAWLELFRDG